MIGKELMQKIDISKKLAIVQKKSKTPNPW